LLGMTDLERGVAARAPEAVSAAAAARGLGVLIDTRTEANPGKAAGGLAVAGGAFVVVFIPSVIALNSISELSPFWSLVDILPRVSFFGALLCFGWAVRVLIRGQRAWYLYSGGVVQQARSEPRVVAWPDATELRTLHSRRRDSNVGAVVGYRLTGRDGSKMAIPLRASEGGRDPFIDRVLASAAEHNCRVI
jgi:hypothetical protein